MGYSEVAQKSNEKVLEGPWDWPLRKPNHSPLLPSKYLFKSFLLQKSPPAHPNPTPSPPNPLQWPHSWCVGSLWLQRQALQSRPLGHARDDAWLLCFQMCHGTQDSCPPAQKFWESPSCLYRFCMDGTKSLSSPLHGFLHPLPKIAFLPGISWIH